MPIFFLINCTLFKRIYMSQKGLKEVFFGGGRIRWRPFSLNIFLEITFTSKLDKKHNLKLWFLWKPPFLRFLDTFEGKIVNFKLYTFSCICLCLYYCLFFSYICNNDIIKCIPLFYLSSADTMAESESEDSRLTVLF